MAYAPKEPNLKHVSPEVAKMAFHAHFGTRHTLFGSPIPRGGAVLVDVRPERKE